MGLRSSDCATFTINIPQSPLSYVAQSNLNKMTPVRPASGCRDGGSSCTFILFWRGAGSVVQLQSWREVLAAVLNKWGERACAYLLSSFTCSAFLFFFSKRRSWKCQPFQGRCLSGNTISWEMVSGDDHDHQIMWPFFGEGEFFSKQIPPNTVGHKLTQIPNWIKAFE